ncbi:N-acyl homoserine lactone hydrolase [Rhodococcus wratislaviensis]|uniref:N-acyl homoserine lactone hydrolase n=2 Tax=Rhodococcus wratislaviensis TaxID=44752 RepID=A0A402CDC5_RHOWR|nr:N-acyl homoserine lactone hydrolase [Rhodococcus wratislaviensis]
MKMSVDQSELSEVAPVADRVLPDIRLYVIRCGELMIYPKSPQECSIPVQWYVLTHPLGNIVIDGGNAPEVARDPRKRWGPIVDVVWPTMKAEDACALQLRDLGIAPESVKWILQTHLHHDHTGAMADIGSFPNASVLARREEYDYARSPDWFYRPSYIEEDFNSPDIPWTFLGDDEDGFDLYGDGVVRVWKTYGHTPGHQSFEITLPQSGRTFLVTGDAVSDKDVWEKKSLPPMTVSNREAAASVEKLHNIARKTGATVIFSHDPVQWLEHSPLPAYYA